jgi:hypothetical protein
MSDEAETTSLPPEISVEQIIENSRKLIQTPYGLQDANGVDVSLIYENLRRTVDERVRRLDRARRDVLWIRANVRRVP